MPSKSRTFIAFVGIASHSDPPADTDLQKPAAKVSETGNSGSMMRKDRTATVVSSRQLVVISGASTGMGAATARYLNRLGYTVLAGVRKDADGERLASSVDFPDRIHPVHLDVTSQPQVAEVAARVGNLRDQGYELAGVFSNAGIAAYTGDLSCEECPIETQERVLQVDHFGAVRLLQAMLPFLRADQGRVVINSALMTHTVLPFNAGYAAAKCALEGWADSLRREVRPHGVKVVILQPAAIASAMETKQDPSKIPGDGPYAVQRDMAEFFLGAQQRIAESPKTDPHLVAELVAYSLQTPRPRARYQVGGGARVIYALGLLPTAVQDAVFTRALQMVHYRMKGRRLLSRASGRQATEVAGS